MFKKKAFQVKMIDDPDTKTIFVPTRPLDYEKINATLKDHIITVGCVIGGIVVAKNLSIALAQTVTNVTWRIVDTKFPYPPYKP